MNQDALLNYTNKCGCWFRATLDKWDAPVSPAAIRDLLAPPLDTEKVCKTRMVQWLSFNTETNTVEGVLYPECAVAGLELLRGNARALAFASVNA